LENKVRGEAALKSPQRIPIDHPANIPRKRIDEPLPINRPSAPSIRGAGVFSNPLPVTSSYFAEVVSTRIVCTH